MLPQDLPRIQRGVNLHPRFKTQIWIQFNIQRLNLGFNPGIQTFNLGFNLGYS